MRRGLAVYTQIFEVVGLLWDCLKKMEIQRNSLKIRILQFFTSINVSKK